MEHSPLTDSQHLFLNLHSFSNGKKLHKFTIYSANTPSHFYPHDKMKYFPPIFPQMINQQKLPKLNAL